MRALIEESGRIAQVAAEDFPVAAPLRWVDVPDDTTPLDTWDGTAVVKAAVPPPAPAPDPTGLQLISVLTDAEAAAIATAKPRDLWTLMARGEDPIPPTNNKVQRLATKAGITVADWYGRTPA